MSNKIGQNWWWVCPTNYWSWQGIRKQFCLCNLVQIVATLLVDQGILQYGFGTSIRKLHYLLAVVGYWPSNFHMTSICTAYTHYIYFAIQSEIAFFFFAAWMCLLSHNPQMPSKVQNFTYSVFFFCKFSLGYWFDWKNWCSKSELAEQDIKIGYYALHGHQMANNLWVEAKMEN